MIMSKTIGISCDAVFEDLLLVAKENRHGKYPAVTYKQRQDYMSFARSVINKTIQWKLKNI
jgi:hypothetical protein